VGGNQKSANSDRTSRPLPISIRHRSQKEPKEISACTCTRAFWPSLQKIGASRTVGGTRWIRPPRTTRVFTHEIRPDFGALFDAIESILPKRICSPGIRLCFGSLRLASSSGPKEEQQCWRESHRRKFVSYFWTSLRVQLLFWECGRLATLGADF